MIDALRRIRCTDAAAVVEHVRTHHHLVVPLAVGEPTTLMAAVDDAGPTLDGVRVHQMHTLHDRAYLHGAHPGLRHVSYFLSPVTRAARAEGGIDLTPAHFLIGRAPFFLEANARMPRTRGENQVHVSQGAGWIETDVATTLRNTVDHVVTEFDVAELRGQPLPVRARRLIDIAHPAFRDELEADARAAGILGG